MKFSIKLLFMILFISILSACGSEDSSQNSDTYDAEELKVALTNTNGEQVELFTSSNKELYLYFTGVQ